MSALDLFKDVWLRADALTAIHGYLARNATAVLKVDELLRAEWVARVSALDLFVHELVAERMVAMFTGLAAPTPQFLKFRVSTETARRIASGSSIEASAAFDLDVRDQLSYLSFQMPEKIADAVRLFSPVPLWSEVSKHQNPGMIGAALDSKKREIKSTLSLIVGRRNKIAHEGDLQPTHPRLPWPMTAEDLSYVRGFIWDLVHSIDAVV